MVGEIMAKTKNSVFNTNANSILKVLEYPVTSGQ